MPAAVALDKAELDKSEPDQTVQFDEQQPDPAVKRAGEALTEVSRQVWFRARRAVSLREVGVVATVLVPLGLVTVLRSGRRRAELIRQSERRSQARYRVLIEQSEDLVLVVDRAGFASFLSPSTERLLTTGTGDRPDDSRPVDLLACVDPADRARLAAALTGATAGQGQAVEVRIAGRRGLRTFAVSVRDLTDQESVGGLLLTAHDVTDRLALQAQTQYRALHDTLTGLPNRALLADRFEQALRGAHRASNAIGLLLIDLDRFKQINDTFGHHCGDELLIQVGARLSAALRDVDTVARLGGDEFAVLLPDVLDVASITAVARKLQAALQAPFHVQGVALDVKASIGLVLSGEHGQDPTTLLQRADTAMYVAKAQHLGVFAYDPAEDGRSLAKLALLGDLRGALQRGELVLHYQPRVSLRTGQVVGAEALVRWPHPDRGLLLPEAFIALAEHTGLIGPLSRQVLSSSLAQARAWADAGRPMPISVNLSAHDLLDERLAGQVAELLAEHGVPAGLLTLEITESAIMTEPVRARRLLQALSALGVRLSIDDFGTGYTSLGQFKTLPVTELKIDKSFVMTMTQDRSNAVIVRSVVDLGHNLGLTVVAEGVQSAQALAVLAQYGCDFAQGYHLSRPITAAAFELWHPAWPTPS